MNATRQFVAIGENTMRLLGVLHNHVLNSVPTLHVSRATALAAAVQSLMDGAFLAVTANGQTAYRVARRRL